MRLRIATLLLLLFTTAAVHAAEEQRKLAFAARTPELPLATEHFLLGPGVVFDESTGTIRLAQSHLHTDEMGATDYHQTERLGGAVQAKKLFVLERAGLEAAELLFFGSASEIAVNGKVIATPQPLPSTGWSRAAVPASLLKDGENVVVFRGTGQLLLEPSKQPARSFKSTDGGQTWQRQGLTSRGNQEGEYLVRLRLRQHPAQGWAMSQVLDLWPSEVALPATLQSVAPLALKDQPEGTTVKTWLRTGSTPAPGDAWSGWQSLEKGYTPAEAGKRHRWAQLKLELASRALPNGKRHTPSIPARFELTYTINTDFANDPALTVTKRQPTIVRGATPFVYQEPSPRLKLLRERYKLDEVIAPGKTEMEQLMLLRYWVRNQWHTGWGNHPSQWMPPWDALIILSCHQQPDCLTMCTHYAAVYVQCCLALGWSARHCILDHHCTMEVYIQQYDKWVMMDAGNSAERADVGLHFERQGVPLSARELHLAHHGKQTDGITVHFTPTTLAKKIQHLCKPAPAPKKPYPPLPDAIPVAELPKYPVCGMPNYRRYAFPARNNLLSTLVPGELYQGWSEYFYDGYQWVGDGWDDVRNSPEYSQVLNPRRPQDVDWKLNWTRIHVSQTGKPGVVRVDLETETPGWLRFEKIVQGEAKPQVVQASFTWQLQPGENALTIRSVNHWERQGTPTTLTVRWQAAK